MSSSLVTTHGSRDEAPFGPVLTGSNPSPDVEIVIPVYNEQLALEGSVRMLHAYLLATFPFSWQITIVDNASTDGTLQVARRLMYELPEVGAMHLPAKGRGRALRIAWSASHA
jgi:glycosyltransferase involved in cell wall biosynthesis